MKSTQVLIRREYADVSIFKLEDASRVGMRVLAIIPARGGSRGIHRKNIRPLKGRPLIGWSIDAAKQASCLTHIIGSTEDDEIASVAREFGADVPFKRPAELASDDTPGRAPVLHAISQLAGYDWVVL